MPTERVSRQDQVEQAAAKVAAAQAVLVEQVAALQSGEDWKRFLAVQARLHQYSPNNVMLISAQHAQAFAEGRVAARTSGVSPGSRPGRPWGGRSTEVSTGTPCSLP